jgi:hypothetical protein
MTWFDIYNEFIKNFEKVNQLQKDYIRNLERINYLYDESIKSIERVNDLYNAYIRNYEKMNRSYEQQFDNMQRMNQKWLDIFSKSSEQDQNEKRANAAARLVNNTVFSNLDAFKTSIQNTRDNLKEFSRIGVNAARTYEQTSRDTTSSFSSS